jgi:hypothetical protein
MMNKIFRLYVYHAYFAAMNGYNITTKAYNSNPKLIAFRLFVLIEPIRDLSEEEKEIYLTSKKKFGSMYRFQMQGISMNNRKFTFTPEPGMNADLQDIINSDLIYKMSP